jgi:phosphatidylglycerol lysyltransferase
VAASPRVDAQLALLGDKDFLFAGGADDGFVMYGVQGRSFVAMGDPVARSEETVSELIWRFKELADARDGTPVFYQITRDHLPLYVDAGFALLKIGEEAWVDLDRFTLQGGQGRKLRQSKSRAENGGASFELVPAGPPVEAILPELRAVSHAWLGEKGREKGFSLGFWTDAYMRRCDQAVVRHAGRIVAFVNVWRSADCNEFSIDLMRQAPDAPGGVMDLLFIGLMNRAKEEGFRWFGLGMAPLSGLPRHHLASLWSRLGALMYRRGDRFYNFEGLRAFKEKFRPEWRPRYLAYPGALGLPQILLDITVLTATSPQRAAPGPAETDGPRPGIIRTAIS